VENFRPVLTSHLLQCHKHLTLTAVMPLLPSKFFLIYRFFDDRRYSLSYWFILPSLSSQTHTPVFCLRVTLSSSGQDITRLLLAQQQPYPLGGLLGTVSLLKQQCRQTSAHQSSKSSLDPVGLNFICRVSYGDSQLQGRGRVCLFVQCHGLTPAGSQALQSRSLTPPWWDGARNGRVKARKLVG